MSDEPKPKTNMDGEYGQPCPDCGVLRKPGDWPYCPHGRAGYSFQMAVKIPGTLKTK